MKSILLILPLLIMSCTKQPLVESKSIEQLERIAPPQWLLGQWGFAIVADSQVVYVDTTKAMHIIASNDWKWYWSDETFVQQYYNKELVSETYGDKEYTLTVTPGVGGSKEEKNEIFRFSWNDSLNTMLFKHNETQTEHNKKFN